MIDHVLGFADEAAAQADPIVGAYWVTSLEGGPGAWRGDCCIPKLFIWDPADNTQVPVNDPNGDPVLDPDGNPVMSEVRHPFDDNWHILIALPEQDPDLTDSAACELVADRDDLNLIECTLPPGLYIEPTFMGSAYSTARPMT